MLKKGLACLVAALLVCLTLGGCNPSASAGGPTDAANTTGKSDETTANPYADHVSFTVFSLDDSDDFMKWPLVVEAMEKFNFDFKIQQVAWDNWDETTRTLVATDSLPEVLSWYNLAYSEYKTWATQGVFKALPDDMSSYANLQTLMDKHDIFSNLKIDGKLYAFPKINNNNPFNTYTPDLFIYRKDWAEQMGKKYDSVQELSWDDFVAYLEELKSADPGKLGDKLVAFDTENGGLDWGTLIKHWNQNFGSYVKVDGKYVWGTDDPSTLTGIRKIKELYDKGLLAKDSYADNMEMGQERFLAGRSAVLNGPYGPTLVESTILLGLKENFADFKETDLGLFALKIDGKYTVSQMQDWWAAFAFSHNCTDAQMNRFLAVGNWLLADEQVEKSAYGIPDTDWTKDSAGNVKINYKSEETVPGQAKAYVVDQRTFQKFYILEGLDTWLTGNPNVSGYIVNDLYQTYMKKQEQSPSYKTIDYNYEFFSGTNKDQYGCLSTETTSALIQAVVSDDPEKVWNDFIAGNKPTIQLVLDEINSGIIK
ncbi:MAG: hypothetical protein VB070_11560 [Clostridiaceae bacterium]|nr:hypothetical protein [Clostridiaceae bacterium]